jgi:hypothetical protein
MKMTKTTTARLFVTAAAVLLVSVSASASRASDPEVLRENLLEFVDEMAGLQPYLYDADELAPAQFEALAEARAELETIAPEQLESMGAALRGYPGWWQIPDTVRTTLVRSRTRSTVRAGDPPTADNCGDSPEGCGSCPDDGGGIGAVTGLKVPELIAEGVFEIINADIGYNIPNPAKIITGVVLFALRISRVSVEGVYRVHEECQQNWNNTLTRTNLDATITSRASAGALQQLQQEVDKLRIDNRRRAIEANMFAFRGAASILSFLLPASQGGYLEEVAEIVLETIETQKVARGILQLRNADDLYNAAEVERLAGRYRAAYEGYRDAYRDAVRL